MTRSVLRSTLTGAAWGFLGGWTQLAVGLVTFTVVARSLHPEDLGAFGVYGMATGLATVACSTPFCDAVQQRHEVEPDHVHATFWLTLLLCLGAGILLLLLAPWIAAAFSAPHAAGLLPWAFLQLPLAAAGNLAGALVARDLRYGELSRWGAANSVASAVVTVAGLLAGFGVASLLAAGILGQALFTARAWAATAYRPAWPQRWAALADLRRFNLSSLALYLLGSADAIIPRLATGLLLGPAALGLYMTAERILQLMTSLVMTPLAGVTMASVARLQADLPAVRRLVTSLYRMATTLAFPACLGLVVVLPDLVILIGERWQAALLAGQILLLTTLRTATGMFNMAILRGLGDGRSPLVLLGCGMALNAILVPVGAVWAGTAGVAAAAVARTWLTWPLGCLFIRRATGLAVRDQIRAGLSSLVAAAGMAAVVVVFRHMVPDASGIWRLAGSLAVGTLTYAALALVLNRRLTLVVASRLWRRDRAGAVQALKEGLAHETASPAEAARMIVFLSTWSHRYTHACLRDELQVLRRMSYVEAFTRRSLPRATYVFSDLDRLGFCQLEMAAGLYRSLREGGCRVLNDPARFPNRLALLQRLYRAQVNTFRAWTAEDWPDVDRFPVFIRTRSAHRGNLTGLLEDGEAVRAALDALTAEGYPLNDLMISQYAAEPFEDDIFRKLSIFRIGDRYVPTITVHEKSWTTKYGTNGVASDRAYEEDLARIRDDTFVEAARAAFETAEIEYGRADFSLVRGRAEFYEINTNPMIGRPGTHRHPARVEAMRLSHDRYVEAFAALDTGGQGRVRPRLPQRLLAGRRLLRLLPGYQWTP